MIRAIRAASKSSIFIPVSNLGTHLNHQICIAAGRRAGVSEGTTEHDEPDNR